MDENVQQFNKYIERGPYHWRELSGGIKRYNAHLAARYEVSIDIIIKHCSGANIIIDIGCGDGVFTTMLAERYGEGTIKGFDYDDTAIKLAKEMTRSKCLSNLLFVKGNAFDQIKNADLITATDVIEHIVMPERFMEDSYKSLKSNGYLFLSTPVKSNEMPADKYHIREFEFKELKDFTMSFGFTVIDHISSHDVSYLNRYKHVFRSGIIKLMPYKYFYNMLALLLGVNVFGKPSCLNPTMQYILLKKT